jgi:hypothetical protein
MLCGKSDSMYQSQLKLKGKVKPFAKIDTVDILNPYLRLTSVKNFPVRDNVSRQASLVAGLLPIRLQRG